MRSPTCPFTSRSFWSPAARSVARLLETRVRSRRYPAPFGKRDGLEPRAGLLVASRRVDVDEPDLAARGHLGADVRIAFETVGERRVPFVAFCLQLGPAVGVNPKGVIGRGRQAQDHAAAVLLDCAGKQLSDPAVNTDVDRSVYMSIGFMTDHRGPAAQRLGDGPARECGPGAAFS